MASLETSPYPLSYTQAGADRLLLCISFPVSLCAPGGWSPLGQRT